VDFEAGEDGVEIDISLRSLLLVCCLSAFTIGLSVGLLASPFLNNSSGDTPVQADAQEGTSSQGSMPTNQNTRVSLDGIDFNGEPSLGDAGADVKIVMYNEFACPFCSEWSGVDVSSNIPIDTRDTRSKLVDRYIDSGKAELIQKNVVQGRLHPNSLQGHKAANCAYNQSPDSYWQYTEGLYENRDQWMEGGEKPLNVFQQIASSQGMNTEEFARCYRNSDGEEAIEDTSKISRVRGPPGTPTFFVGNREEGFVKIEGAQPIRSFESAYQKVA
jgi:protein-disulfide isomerase